MSRTQSINITLVPCGPDSPVRRRIEESRRTGQPTAYDMAVARWLADRALAEARARREAAL